MTLKFYLNLNWISKWTSSPISAQNPSKQFSSFSKITEKSLSESRTKILVEVVRVEIEAMFSEKSTKIFFQPGSRKVYEFSRVFSRVSSRFSKSQTIEYSEDSYKRLKLMNLTSGLQAASIWMQIVILVISERNFWPLKYNLMVKIFIKFLELKIWNLFSKLDFVRL